jgi:hypothetical protein
MQVRQNVDDDDLNDDGHNAWSRSTTVPDGGRVRVPLNLMDSVQEQIFYASRPGYRTMSDAGWDDDYAKARRLADQSRADYIARLTAGRAANSPNGGPLSVDRVARRLAEIYKLAPPVESYGQPPRDPTVRGSPPYRGGAEAADPGERTDDGLFGSPPMKTCDNCGTRMVRHATFCPSCQEPQASGMKQRPTDAAGLQAIRDQSYAGYIASLHSQHPSNRRRLS